MCGIVGLFIKTPALEPELGSMMTRMLGTMCERGPDSAGFAIYGDETPGTVKLTIRAKDTSFDFGALKTALTKELDADVSIAAYATHAVVSVPEALEPRAQLYIEATHDGVDIVGSGTRMEIFKAIGRPDDVADQFELSKMAGSHGIAHTRMATESAVTTSGAHPFSTGQDQCLVHNGSLSNHNALRRALRRDGMTFETENDSEVAAGYLTQRMKDGSSLGEALEQALDDLDGFYTFVVGTRDGFGVLRDPIACKPAIMAETEDYVAFGSEYRALAGLPGIDTAKVWEPEPGTVYFWERSA
ncbi:MAG: glutamine amidotransferase family protein [Pseudomonadota bacterium]